MTTTLCACERGSRPLQIDGVPSSHTVVSGPAVQACLVVLGTHVAGVSLGHYQHAWLYCRTLQMPFTVFVYAFLLYRKAGDYEFSL